MNDIDRIENALHFIDATDRETWVNMGMKQGESMNDIDRIENVSDTPAKQAVIRFCKRCNADTPRDAKGQCKPCVSIRNKAYREAHKEKIGDGKLAWSRANKDHVNAKSRAYAKANPEQRKATTAKYRSDHAEEIKAQAASYYKENAERFREEKAVWRRENKDKVRERNQRYYESHQDEIRLRQAEFRKNNPEISSGYTKKWRSKNQEAFRAYVARWACENKDLKRISQQNRRSRKASSGGTLSKDIKDRLFDLQKGKCACCGEPLRPGYHLDHIIPLALGGSNSDDNVQLLNSTCNLQKAAKHPVDFMQERGFLL